MLQCPGPALCLHLDGTSCSGLAGSRCSGRWIAAMFLMRTKNNNKGGCSITVPCPLEKMS